MYHGEDRFGGPGPETGPTATITVSTPVRVQGPDLRLATDQVLVVMVPLGPPLRAKQHRSSIWNHTFDSLFVFFWIFWHETASSHVPVVYNAGTTAIAQSFGASSTNKEVSKHKAGHPQDRSDRILVPMCGGCCRRTPGICCQGMHVLCHQAVCQFKRSRGVRQSQNPDVLRVLHVRLTKRYTVCQLQKSLSFGQAVDHQRLEQAPAIKTGMHRPSHTLQATKRHTEHAECQECMPRVIQTGAGGG